MPESPRTSRWILLGRALPKRTRERVFEPAFYDLIRQQMDGASRGHLGLGGRALALFAGSIAVDSWRVLVSRQAIMIGIILLTLVLLVAALQSWMGQAYAA